MQFYTLELRKKDVLNKANSLYCQRKKDLHETYVSLKTILCSFIKIVVCQNIFLTHRNTKASVKTTQKSLQSLIILVKSFFCALPKLGIQNALFFSMYVVHCLFKLLLNIIIVNSEIFLVKSLKFYFNFIMLSISSFFNCV